MYRSEGAYMEKLFSKVPYIKGDGIVIRGIDERDTQALKELTDNDNVYKFLPTFLFEKNAGDIDTVIREMYGELFSSKESIILGIHRDSDDYMCGLAEFYGYKDSIHKISIGYRLSERFWGQGIASLTVKAMVDYLYTNTDIEIITASTMIENKASARVLEKNGFSLVVSGADEDWGYPLPTKSDKWIR
jgi:ribosomal-protein-alanine N-acetyltransferase